MALSDFVAELDALVEGAKAAFASAADADALEAARVEYVGAKAGKLKAAQKGMGSVDKGDKPAAGKKFNEVKGLVEAAFAAAQERLAGSATKGEQEAFDATEPGDPLRLGRLHPITQTIAEMRDIMGRLGFTAVEGPEIEDDWHNFVALNIPETHPARDPLDNFYLSTASGLAAGDSDDNALLLRSQTSTVQIRVMEDCIAGVASGDGPPPVRIISLGRVYRPDTADATHYPMFHQIEGLLIDKGVTMADLKSVLRLFCQSFYQMGEGQGSEDIHVRFRPSFFPFTEPSVEVDINWQGGWMEIGGAGMVDPNVLRAVGYDPEEVTGFAFGLGVERIAMRRHNITDIRALYENDVRFLEQF
ncbi:phenylalanine--tRNA ligase subunit alpha [Adhaeretor mobilis]|uniref:Phenylalanine--tRNA ligase alpha subunit n=1 Tax=Adhaeretor mobilis TaxID=1930276 RepID=A0A517MRY3_9BACT|nr:phenylalanine--tRNA ligase subunit alpha [Adhaeretor mobilis]QDS97641.1 Phenylalanine--tRNA ligase alpha subunit [Adhaeretor mobilis]